MIAFTKEGCKSVATFASSSESIKFSVEKILRTLSRDDGRQREGKRHFKILVTVTMGLR